MCAKCKIKQRKNGTEYCIVCNPDYVPNRPGFSRVACEFLCAVERFLGHPVRHAHFDKISKGLVGSEYRLVEWTVKPVDGYFERKRVDGTVERVVIEFLGDYYHGHPRFWKDNALTRDRFDRLHKDNFDRTQRILKDVANFGYTVYYIWECEYLQAKKAGCQFGTVRRFRGVLEH